jgi:hypothetical protein
MLRCFRSSYLLLVACMTGATACASPGSIAVTEVRPLLAGDTRGDTLRDLQHPASFTTVVEETTGDESYCVYARRVRPYACKFKSGSNNPDAEVDRRSRIRIAFDPNEVDALADFAGGELTIEAHLTKKNGAQPAIEVPGYSVIGEQAKVEPIHIKSGNEMVATLAHLGQLYTRLHTELQNVESNTLLATIQDSTQKRGLKLRLSVLRSRSDSLQKALTLLQRQASDTVEVLLAEAANTAAARDSTQLRQNVRSLDERLGELSKQLRSTNIEADSVSRSLAGSGADFADIGVRVRLESSAKRRLVTLDDRSVISALLKKATAAGDTLLFNEAIRRAAKSPDVFVAVALDIEKHYAALAAISGDDAISREAIDRAVGEILDGLKNFDELGLGSIAGQEQRARDLRRLIPGYLRDAYILVPATGAEPGDFITIVVKNKSGSAPLAREFSIRVLVRQFGLNQRTNDSFLFLRRDDNPAEFGVGPDTVASPYRYVPTAGVTFGWSLETRRQWGGRFFSTLLRWLEPGFGFNVSFPRFTDRARRRDPATSEVLTQDLSGNTFDLAVGGIASLFGGAVQFTYGSNLTAERDRSYWGVGFSFLRTISEIGERIRRID